MDQDDADAPEGMTPGLNARAMNVWDQVIDDMEATAEELEEAGWETVQLHPGDVTVETSTVPDPGIDVLLPNPEYEAVEALVEGGAQFTEYEIYRADGTEIEYAVVVAMDPGRETALLVPIYYQVSDLQEAVRMQESIPLYLRQLTEETVRIDLSSPELLVEAVE